MLCGSLVLRRRTRTVDSAARPRQTIVGYASKNLIGKALTQMMEKKVGRSGTGRAAQPERRQPHLESEDQRRPTWPAPVSSSVTGYYQGMHR